MENWDLYFFSILSGLLILGVIIITTIMIVKTSRKKALMVTYFGLKRAKVTFKIFDTCIIHSLFVFPNRQYVVVCRLYTEEGNISFSIVESVNVYSHY